MLLAELAGSVSGSVSVAVNELEPWFSLAGQPQAIDPLSDAGCTPTTLVKVRAGVVGWLRCGLCWCAAQWQVAVVAE